MNAGLRIPPHSEKSERGIVGSIMLEPDRVIPKLLKAGLRPNDFYDRRHQVLYEQMLDMYAAMPRGMDALTIADWLKDKNAIEMAGGYDYLVQIQDSTLVTAHVEHYTKNVLNKKLYRSIIEEAAGAMDRAYKGESDAIEILNETRSSLYALDRERGHKGISNEEACNAVIERWRQVLEGRKFGLPWNVPEIGDVFGNFQSNGNPYFLAAEPGGGKSVCLQNLFTKWSIMMGKPSGIASIEMTKQKLMARLMSERASIPAWGLDNGYYGQGSRDQQKAQAEEWIKKAEHIKREIIAAPLYINDAHMNTDEVMAWGLAMYEQYGIVAFGIDYFQLLSPPPTKKYEGLDAVKYNCEKLLSFSKGTGVITVVLSQLTKLPTNASGQPRDPRQDDLFGGRIIDAHSEGTVIFYNRDGVDKAMIAKNRNGSTGIIDFKFNRPFLRFESLGMDSNKHPAKNQWRD
ncbi:MAG: hypothetical protein JW713_06470 [Pontiellaceae bacterium]|nr:hypothetical protein [Pontiellaceae bacterium]